MNEQAYFEQFAGDTRPHEVSLWYGGKCPVCGETHTYLRNKKRVFPIIIDCYSCGHVYEWPPKKVHCA